MHNTAVKISTVFPSNAQPTITYVKRNEGRYERELSAAIDDGGQVCLVTGTSKTGKTTLYRNVLSTKGLKPLTIRCDDELSPTEFWRKALELVKYERLRELTSKKGNEIDTTGKLGGSIGWKWLAGLKGEGTVGAKKEHSETETHELVLANPSANHLVPILQQMSLILVVEDFHQLQENVKKTIFQQWKAFVDGHVSVIVVSTTHRAGDIAAANKDLLGRINHIEVSRWQNDDLHQIITLGFKHLGVSLPGQSRHISNESAGLPIITQQICAQLFLTKGITEATPPIKGVSFVDQDVYGALNAVATYKYGSLGVQYTNLINGPRSSKSRYRTYELVLSCFTLNPLKFELHRDEIDSRLKQLQIPESEQIPPSVSINAMLNAIDRVQKDNDLELLEWRPLERTLYILDPALLFFIRWHKPRKEPPDTATILSELLDKKVLPFLGKGVPWTHK